VTAGRSVAAAVVLFVVLATANSGGYRYGASDHAFYAAAIAERADPSLFPRDAPLLAAQSRLWLGDDLIGGLARLTTTDLPTLFVPIYLATLAVLFAAGVAFMRSIGGSPWATAGFLLLLTLRHRISKTGANTLEGYMHPRILVFAIGLIALAAIVRGRRGLAIVLLAAGAALHTTTALWFAIVVGVAIVVQALPAGDGGRQAVRAVARRAWPWLAAAVVAIAAAAAWAFTSGPLANRLVVIDPAWLAVLDSKDYLFPTGWPAYAWVTNLAYPLVLALLYAHRRRRQLVSAGERAVLAGLLVLVGIFLLSVPFTAWRMALAVQMQVNRVFWVLDAVTAAYVAWWLLDVVAGPAKAAAPDGPTAGWRPARVAVLALLLAVSAGRGIYILAVEAQRPFFEVRPHGDWIDAMAWLREQPGRWHVLADPQHAWKHGVSVRVAALRDTVLEVSKDSALAMYDRAIAMRVADRAAALADFDRLTTAGARALDARYDVDALVVEHPASVELPVLYRNARFVIYDLR
jgi:hypothetical protein